MTTLPHFEPGFRLIDGSDLNKLVDEINAIAGGGGTLPVSGTTGNFSSNVAVGGNQTITGTLGVTGTSTFSAISLSAAGGNVTGLAAAQGGNLTISAGTSATSANAGGAANVAGGLPGATGVGGAAVVVGGIGGATSGAGGAASVTGGAGTAGNAIGGAASVTGGAGQGTAAGGSAVLVGGASGGGATGDGGDALIAGGNATSVAGNGGAVILTGGAKTTTGRKGSIITRGQNLAQAQVAPTAKTVTAAISAAELATGIITTTGVTAPSIHQLPTGTLLLAEFPDFAANDSFDFSVINTGVGASDDATLTVNTDVTIVGNPTIGALTDATIIAGSGRFRARYTGGVTWIVYRLA